MNPERSSPVPHRAFIALGSNVGDRIEMIETACLELDRANIKVKRTSSLFETEPIYQVETTLEPMQLLNALQSIEMELGRKKLIDKGPRSIDLDILLYDQEVFSHERLNVPHNLMLERDFVLRPLCQLIPHERPPQPDKNTQTYNSFSDGGKHSPHDMTYITETVRTFIAQGATIIDIGGESTRPGSTPVGADEEIARVVPAIKHIRANIPEAAHIAISIDTYRAGVAEAACAAGADIINDVSAGTLDPDMLSTAARINKTIILMHMRGTPQTMTTLVDYPNGVIPGESPSYASASSPPKRPNQPEDLEVLRELPKLRAAEGLEYLPWLMGPSRKRFIGHITGVKTARERVWGTAATVTASVAGGADIVRVHDVHEMWQAARVADAIYRVE
ncbi:uncharacterized protein N7477_008598 [Penicillium maclennaniae]|uniref:uncharacterized protein n=1 Tax=Penicillium maclennaniae TaxID=1343394 RepID=UPI0025407137|nr:uncharacterized protein N7477_008598 [Penicillium maclennaniae]KAJ5666150.1 hypothetical protein N7477_008598 [Penicillium maclennaniae]